MVQEFRKDGWPLCPQCGEDELASDLLLKGDVHRYERRPDLTMADYPASTFFCYQCQWQGTVQVRLPAPPKILCPRCQGNRIRYDHDLDTGQEQLPRLRWYICEDCEHEFG